MVVANRSGIIKVIKDCYTAQDCNQRFEEFREEIRRKGKVLEVEELPKHVDYSFVYAQERRIQRKNSKKNEENFDFS